LLTAARTNWNFEFAQTANIFNAKFTTRLEHVNVYYQRLLTLVILFIINPFINVYYYYFGRSAHLGYGSFSVFLDFALWICFPNTACLLFSMRTLTLAYAMSQKVVRFALYSPASRLYRETMAVLRII